MAESSEYKESLGKLGDFFGKMGDAVEMPVVNGRKFLAYLSYDCVAHLQDWDIPRNSTFIMSFPKTGTNWSLEIVRHILFADDEKTLEEATAVPFPLLLLEMPPKMKFDLSLPGNIFCSHLPEHFFNFGNIRKSDSKIIYVIRNPKDQTVSWYSFANMFNMTEKYQEMLGSCWDEFIAKYMHGEHPFGMEEGGWYPDHILQWLKHKNDPNFLLVEYEALKKDFLTEIHRIAKFLGVNLSEEAANRTMKACSVESMKERASSDENGYRKLYIRKGEVGGWKNHFTVSQSELMDKLVEEKMKGSGIRFTYSL